MESEHNVINNESWTKCWPKSVWMLVRVMCVRAAGRLYREQSREYESTDQYNVITPQSVNRLETLWLEPTLCTPHLLTFIYTIDSRRTHISVINELTMRSCASLWFDEDCGALLLTHNNLWWKSQKANANYIYYD